MTHWVWALGWVITWKGRMMENPAGGRRQLRLLNFVICTTLAPELYVGDSFAWWVKVVHGLAWIDEYKERTFDNESIDAQTSDADIVRPWCTTVLSDELSNCYVTTQRIILYLKERQAKTALGIAATKFGSDRNIKMLRPLTLLVEIIMMHCLEQNAQLCSLMLSMILLFHLKLRKACCCYDWVYWKWFHYYSTSPIRWAYV